MSQRELKDVAAEHFRKGRFSKAADAFLALSKAEPQEPQHLIKLGDSYRRDGRKDPALFAYRAAVDLYARRGVIIKAIAACKLILEIDPARKDAQEELAKLCAQRYVRRVDPARSVSLAPHKNLPAGVVEGVDVPFGVELDPGARDEADWLREEVYVPTKDPVQPPAVAAPPVMYPRVLAAAPASGGIVSDADFSTGPLSGASRGNDRQRAAPRDLALEMAAAAARDGEIEELPADALIMEASLPGHPPATAENTGEKEVMAVVASAARRPATAMANILSQASYHDEEIEIIAVRAGDPSLLPKGPAAQGAAKASASPREITSLPVSITDVDQRAVPLFSELPREAFLDLLEQLAFRRVATGDVILREGDPGKSIFVLASGRADVVKAGPGGKPLHLATLEEGSFFGEMALLNGAPRVASVVAKEDCEILEMTEAILRDLTAKHPSVGQSLKRFYRQRLLQNVMSISPLFRGFDKANRRALVEKFKLREHRANELIITEGQPADGLYVLMHGAALVQKRDPKSGRTIPLGVLKEGDVFGEMSLLTHAPATATVVTRRRTLILRLPKPTFDELMFTHPSVLEVVSELSDQRTRVNEQILSGSVDAPGEALAFL